MQIYDSTALKNQYTYYQKIAMILKAMIPQTSNSNKSFSSNLKKIQLSQTNFMV